MSKRLEVWQAISALLDADKAPKDIVAALKCSCTPMFKVQRLKKAGDTDLKHAFKPRKAKTLTPRVRAAIRRSVRAAPRKSLRKISRESSAARESVRKVVVEAGWKSLRRVKLPLISAEGRKRRASCAVGLINALKLLP